MKKFVFSLQMTVVFLCLTACGVPSPPNEKEIAKDLPDDVVTAVINDPFNAINSNTYTLNIKKVSIDKRQTNEKEDIAYCVVELENEYYCFTKYVKLYYNYYDKGGWSLEGYSEYQDSAWKLISCPFDVEEASSALNDYTDIQYVEKNEDFDAGTIRFIFAVEDEYENVAAKGNVAVALEFDGDSWECNIDASNVDLEWDIEDHWYSSIYSGIYLDILELNDTSAIVEVVYENTAENALAGEKGPLIDVSDERYWHTKVETTDLWEKYTKDGEPYLQFRFYFSEWSDTWTIYVFRDSAFAQVRKYPETELYRVQYNPFLPNQNEESMYILTDKCTYDGDWTMHQHSWAEWSYDDIGHKSTYNIYRSERLFNFELWEYSEDYTTFRVRSCEGTDNSIVFNQYSDEGFLIGYKEYTYDEDGNELGWRDCEKDGTVNSRSERTYDADGNELIFKTWDGGKLTNWKENIYDSTENKLIRKSYSEDGTTICWEEYMYDANGNELSVKSYNGDSVLEYWTESSYDLYGNMISNKIYYHGIMTSWNEYSYKYNAKGDVLSKEHRDGDGTLIDRCEYTYDEKGNMSSEAHYNAEGALEIYTLYKYQLVRVPAQTYNAWLEVSQWW